jgi:hypothetical protein
MVVNILAKMWPVALGVALLLATTLFAPGAEKVADLRLTQTLSLAGVKGRIDHLAYDPGHERLFVCALGNDSVEVIDLRGGKRVHSISGLGSPQGIAYVPKPERLYVPTRWDRENLQPGIISALGRSEPPG